MTRTRISDPERLGSRKLSRYRVIRYDKRRHFILWEKNSSCRIFFSCLYPEYLPVEGIETCFTGIKFRKKRMLGKRKTIEKGSIHRDGFAFIIWH